MERTDTILLALMDRDLRKEVTDALEDRDDMELMGEVDDACEAVQVALTANPTIVIISATPVNAWEEACTYLSLVSPLTWIILLVADGISRETISMAMLLGVRQVLPCPEGVADLPNVIDRLRALQGKTESRDYLMAADPMKCPRLIAVSGAKGGVGKTTLAANLGAALASKNVGPVVIWDAYCQFGDVASVMGLPTNRTLAELAQLKTGDLDEDLILNYAIHHESGADVLLCSDTPLPLGAVGEGFADQVVKALRRKYRFAVVDTPPLFDALSTAIFSRCWRLLVVTTLRDVTSISDAMRMIQAVTHSARGASVRLVANRVGRGDSVKEKDVRGLLGQPLCAAIPEDPTVAQANNLGVPVFKSAPHSPASRALMQLADTIIQSASTFAPDAP